MSDEQRTELAAVFDAITIKHQLALVAAKVLRGTPEYAAARSEGRARAWLAEESNSAAEAMYEFLVFRRDEGLD